MFAQMVAQAMGAVAVVVPYVSLYHAAVWPLSVLQSLDDHFDWHVSSAAWPLSVLQSWQPVSHFDGHSYSAALPGSL